MAEMKKPRVLFAAVLLLLCASGSHARLFGTSSTRQVGYGQERQERVVPMNSNSGSGGYELGAGVQEASWTGGDAEVEEAATENGGFAPQGQFGWEQDTQEGARQQEEAPQEGQQFGEEGAAEAFGQEHQEEGEAAFGQQGEGDEGAAAAAWDNEPAAADESVVVGEVQDEQNAEEWEAQEEAEEEAERVEEDKQEQEWEEEYEEARNDLEKFGGEGIEAAGAAAAAAQGYEAEPVSPEGQQQEEEPAAAHEADEPLSPVEHPQTLLDLDGPEDPQRPVDGAQELLREEAVLEGQAAEEGAEEVADWVLSLATALREGDEGGMEAAFKLAVEANELDALREVVDEAADMINGDMLVSVWRRMGYQRESPKADAATELAQEYAAADKLNAEAETMEEEAEGMMAEAGTMREGADELKGHTQTIDNESNEYSRIEATDELGETAEALDGEATKLELEAAKLKAESVKIEQEVDSLQGMGDNGDEVSTLLNEQKRLSEEADKLKSEAEDLHSRANNLDVEADRIERIEAEKMAEDERARQERIDQDLGGIFEGAEETGAAEESLGEVYEPHGHSPLSHMALVNRFKTLLRTN